ncbi:MAG: hypothetical protein ACLP9S_19510 [Syntrophales bacterium]|jgi:hypothetical protein
MTHTFLLQEGVWIARGHYFDDMERILPLEGIVRITHLEGLWLNEGQAEIKMGENKVNIHSRYEIIPFEEGKSQTTWESVNPDLGILQGQIVIAADTIISTCRSEEGEYTGADFHIKVSDVHYKNRGILLKGNDKLSSWSVDMQKSFQDL